MASWASIEAEGFSAAGDADAGVDDMPTALTPTPTREGLSTTIHSDYERRFVDYFFFYPVTLFLQKADLAMALLTLLALTAAMQVEELTSKLSSSPI